MIRNSSTKGELKGLLSPTGQPQKVVVVPWAGMAEKGLSAFPKTRKTTEMASESILGSTQRQRRQNAQKTLRLGWVELQPMLLQHTTRPRRWDGRWGQCYEEEGGCMSRPQAMNGGWLISLRVHAVHRRQQYNVRAVHVPVVVCTPAQTVLQAPTAVSVNLNPKTGCCCSWWEC